MKTRSKWVWLPFLAAAIGAIGTRAQDFSIDWFGLAGGGGGSSLGGDFELSATIGQPEAGQMLAGDFALVGGFWSIIGVEETPGLPRLNIRLAADAIILSWPEAGTDRFTLEQWGALGDAASSWFPLDAIPDVSNGTRTVRLRLAPGNHFYRLHQP